MVGRLSGNPSDKVESVKSLIFEELDAVGVIFVKSSTLNRFGSDLNHSRSDAVSWSECNHMGHALLQKCVKKSFVAT